MSNPPPPKPSKRRRLLPLLKWVIALLGIILVVRSLTWHDHLWVVNPSTMLLSHGGILGDPPENEWPVTIELEDGTQRVVPKAEAVSLVKGVKATRLADGATLIILAADQPGTPTRFFAAPDSKTPGVWYTPDQLRIENLDPTVLPPQREIGLHRMIREADTKYLLLAVLVIPVVYLITGYRWYLLLWVLGVPITVWQAVQINLVGAFYNTFLPGQTGGDFLKAYYAAKLAHTQRTAAILSVVVDRAIGLVALVIMGGVCAAAQWHIPECRKVSVGALLIIAGLTFGLLVLAVTPIRKALGFDFLLRKLPMQEKVEKLIDALRLYKARPGLVFGTLAMSFPVHATVVVSAMFAGFAFGLPLKPGYYWVVVPTVVLAGAMPISPQGAGVMEFFAVILTRSQGVTVGQAFALTMSIRLVQIVWNLLAGILVFKGGYTKPTEAEAEQDDPTAEPAHPPV